MELCTMSLCLYEMFHKCPPYKLLYLNCCTNVPGQVETDTQTDAEAGCKKEMYILYDIEKMKMICPYIHCFVLWQIHISCHDRYSSDGCS